MLLLDVNVLVYAHREDPKDPSRQHDRLVRVLSGGEAFGISELALGGLLKGVTHPPIFDPPSPLAAACEFAAAVRDRPNCVIVAPGERHWGLFLELIQAVGARGNLIPDAYFAALAIESGSEWITTDRDFSRFPGLRWRHPLEA